MKVEGLRLQGWRPEPSPPAKIKLAAGGASVETTVSAGVFTLDVALPQATQEAFRVQVQCDVLPPLDSDDRELAFRLMEIRVKHPLWALFQEVRK